MSTPARSAAWTQLMRSLSPIVTGVPLTWTVAMSAGGRSLARLAELSVQFIGGHHLGAVALDHAAPLLHRERVVRQHAVRAARDHQFAMCDGLHEMRGVA